MAKSARTTDEENLQFLSVHTSGKVHSPATVVAGMPSSHSGGSVLKTPLKILFHTTSTNSNYSNHSNSNYSNKNAGPMSPGASKIFTKEEPPIVHYPFSVSSLDQFSPQRRVWLHNCLSPSGIAATGEVMATKAAVLNRNVLKSEPAWDTIEDHHLRQQHQLVKQAAYNNPNEATGLLFVKCKSQGYNTAFSFLTVGRRSIRCDTKQRKWMLVGF